MFYGTEHEGMIFSGVGMVRAKADNAEVRAEAEAHFGSAKRKQ